VLEKSVKIISEIGNTHEGSLGIALSLIDMSAAAGADIVKFQMHMPTFESSNKETFRDNSFPQDNTRQDYWQRVSFKIEDWIKIKKHCDLKNIEFLCTPFSVEAAKVLWDNRLVKRWKIGSGEISNLRLLDYVFNTNLEVLISTGLTTQSELDELVDLIRKSHDIDSLVIMHCVSQYPTNLDNSALNLIDFYRERYGVKIGHSDHSGNISSSILALSLPINYLEVHLKPHDLFFGPDISSSLSPNEISFLVKIRDDFALIKSFKMDRDELFKASEKTAKLFRKGLYWSRSINVNETVIDSDIDLRKPEGDISAMKLDFFIGRKLVKNVVEGEIVRITDFSKNYEK
jgi:N-acetylneuraminate synthase